MVGLKSVVGTGLDMLFVKLAIGGKDASGTWWSTG